MGVLTNYITEKIKEFRYVSVDDDGVTKKKLILQPIDAEHIEFDLIDIDSLDLSSAVAALVDSAPSTLNTLNELAAALGDDPNFATTIAATLAGKQDVIPNGTYVLGDPVASLTYNADGTVATATENGIVTTFTYNADGTVATTTRLGVTRIYTYTDGNLTAVA